MTEATAIGFFGHSERMPTSMDLMRAYHSLLDRFQELQIEANWFAAGDGHGRTQWKKFGSAVHQKVLGSTASDFQSVSICATVPGSKAPAHENYAEASFLFSPVGKQVSLTAAFHEPHLLLGSQACDSVVRELASVWKWDYGFVLKRDSSRMPLAFLSGGISRTETPEERRRIERWYACYQPEERRKRIRDIFPYNMVGLGHLEHRLPDGRSLREFIQSDADSELRPLADNLWLWKVRPDRTEAVRERLHGAGVIISE